MRTKLASYKVVAGSFIQSLRINGVWRTLLIVAGSFDGYAFDRRLRVRTTGIDATSEIEPQNPAASHAGLSQASRVRPLMELLQKRLNVGGGFVDFGCGRGRAMLIAAEAGFTTISGIEFCEQIHQAARDNCRRYLEFHPDHRFEVLHQDMVSFQPSVERGDRFFYFFHPADEKILAQCAENLRRFYELHQREMIIIYHNNLSRNLDFLKPFFNDFQRQEFLIRGNLFHVFTSDPTGRVTSKI